MLDLIVPVLPENTQYVHEFQIELGVSKKVQSLELYSNIYLINANRFKDLYEVLPLPVYYTLALANYNRYLEVVEELSTLR